MISGNHKRARLAAALIIATASTVSTAGAAGLPTEECSPTQVAGTAVAEELIELEDLQAIAEGLIELAELQDVRAAVWIDRDMDAPDIRAWREEWRHAHIAPMAEAWTLAGATTDAVVSAARFPARAGLAARHILGAFAKVTPRVVRSLF